MPKRYFATIIVLITALTAIAFLPLAASSSAAPKPPSDPLVWVSLIAASDARLDKYFIGQTYHRSIGQLQRISGHVYSSTVTALQHQANVIHVANSGDIPLPPQSEPEQPIAQTNIASPKTPLRSSPQAPQSWFENDTQGVRETWNTYNLTGTGVTIGIIDSGADFANPALNGRYAIESTTITSALPYNGWPIAFDDRSLAAYLNAPAQAWPANWGWYVNTSYIISGSGAFTFTDPLSSTKIYTAPNTSLSGQYHWGYHPDAALKTGVYSMPILVADETIGGQYDAVYIDLDKDGIFETRVTKNQPVAALDLNGDGVPDRSGGMIYWIADGVNPLPGAEAVYGTGTPVAANGTLIAFMIDTTTGSSGGGHGTMCASTALGNDGGIFTATLSIPAWYSTAYGPIVQGPAPGAKLIAMGNVYAGGTPDAWYLFALVGYDGLPHSGDEPSMISLSYANSSIDNDGWDWESRFLDYLNLYFDQQYGSGSSPLFIHSAGNGGYGAGTLISPNPDTGLTVGAATQYGTTNSWGVSETVNSAARVNYGDIARFSGRGPGANGTHVVDLVANGMAGTGAYPLNDATFSQNNGRRAYVNWTGTSRSAPVTLGMAALTAQAFKQTHGRSPTREELSQLLMNGAIDHTDDPLLQGAGRANAFRSAQLALEAYGLTIDPPKITAGTYRDRRYPAFAGGLQRGSLETETITLTNISSVSITVALGAQQLIEVAHYTATLQNITDTATNYGFGTPDYAINLTQWITANPDADLMVVRLTYPFEHFDTLPPSPSNISNTWRLIIYNWWDDNLNGTWWTDTITPDGRIDWPGELDSGDQWLRFDYSQSIATQQEVRVRRPYARSVGAGSAGVWAGATHNTFNTNNNRTTLTFDVIFYRESDWPDVVLSTNTLQLAANSSTTITALIQVPVTSSFGIHSGSIVITDSGRLDIHSTFKPHTSLMPVTWQVEPDAAIGSQINDQVLGGFGWSGVGETGDWHYTTFDLDHPPPGSAILAHSTWTDYPTDIDTLFFGPTLDAFSDLYPDWFGPYSLDTVGGSLRSGTRPNWKFNTATGTTEEWASTLAQDGLNILTQQAVLFGGHLSSVPFTTALGLAYLQPYPLKIDPSCVNCIVTATFRSSLDITNGLTGTHAFGWASAATAAFVITPGGNITSTLVFTQAMQRVDISLTHVLSATDLDLYLYDNTGSISGALDSADKLIAESFGGGISKSLTVHQLITGTYWVVIAGEAVDSGGGSFTLRTLAIPTGSDGALIFVTLPVSVIAGQIYTISLQLNSSIVNGQNGLLVLGPQWLPSALELPISIEPQSTTPTAIVIASFAAYSSTSNTLLVVALIFGLALISISTLTIRTHRPRGVREEAILK